MTALSTSNMSQISRKRFGPSQLDLAEWAARDAAPTTTRCLTCGDHHQGTAEEGRLWHYAHRKDEHGWKPKRRRKR